VTISCETANEMLAAFSMNSLERQEHGEVVEHLDGCRLHDTDLAELRAVVAALPLSVDEVAPPSRLRSRLLSEFDRDSGRSPGTFAGTRGRSASWLRPPFGYALAAVLALVALGMGAWNLSLRSGEEVTVHTIEQNGMEMRVLYLKNEGVAVLEVVLPAVASDRTYQAWRIPDQGAPESLGVIHNQGAFAFHTSLEGAKAIAISVEPLGGSAQPTTTPVLVQEL
jgi:anti-sigma-K factor RskA